MHCIRLPTAQAFFFGVDLMKHTGQERYNITEAAQRLGVAEITLRRKVWQGKIACYRPSGLGGRILFWEQHLREFEQRHTHKAQAA